MTYGITPVGFLKKAVSDIISEIENDERAALNPTLNLLATSILGQINGVFADKLRELWDIAEAVYRSQYPESASDEALDQVASITGATRLPATKSQVVLDRINLDPGTTLPAGRLVSLGSAGAQFRTLAPVTNSLSTPWSFAVDAESEDYGPITGYAGTIDTIQTPVTGWSAAAWLFNGTPEPYDLDDGDTLQIQIDGGIVQTVTFETGDFVDIDAATAAEVAAVIAASITGGDSDAIGTLVRILSDTEGTGSSVQIVGGTAAVKLDFSTDIMEGMNSEDAIVGRNLEADDAFRLRREQLLRVTGAGTLEAIRARVLELDDVLQVFIFENVTMTTDLNGLPPKSFEVVVAGGDSAEIAETIFLAKPAGIEAFGNVTESVLDSMGFSHSISYSRPAEIEIWIELTVTTDPLLFPADGEDQIKAALKAFGDTMQIGDDVIALQYRCVPLSVAGVIDVTVFLIDIVDPPVNTGNLTIAFRDLAVFDTSRIDVTVT